MFVTFKRSSLFSARANLDAKRDALKIVSVINDWPNKNEN